MWYQAMKRYGGTEIHMTKYKKPAWKGYILYDFNDMTSGKGKTMDTLKR